MSKGSRHRSYSDKFRNAPYWEKLEAKLAKKQPETRTNPTTKHKEWTSTDQKKQQKSS